MENSMEQQATIKVGTTTFIIHSIFDENASETIAQKVKSLIEEAAESR